MEIDLRCGKILPQFWIIQFTNKIVRSVLAFISRKPGVPILVGSMFSSVFSCMFILGTNRYYRRKDKEEIASCRLAWETNLAKGDTTTLAIRTARLKEMMDWLTGSTRS